jgi:hypothetical protein
MAWAELEETMLKSLTRAVAVAAAAATSALALTGTANATVLPVRIHTTLSIVESRNVIRGGRVDVISGRLAAGRLGLGDRVVYLDRLTGGRLTEVRVTFTGPHGGVSFVVQPGSTARYELVFKGTALLAPTHSGVVTVRVAR